MWKYWLCLALLVLFGAYCLYAAAFFAWVTATPISPENLERARLLCQVWAIGFLFSLLAVAGVVWRMRVLTKRRKGIAK